MSDRDAWQQQAKTALQQLTPPGKPVSNAQRFRSLLPDIEQRIADGVPQSDIVAALNDVGLHMNLETFRNYLSTARKRLKATPNEKRKTAPPPLSAAIQPATPLAAIKPTIGDHRSTRDRKLRW